MCVAMYIYIYQTRTHTHTYTKNIGEVREIYKRRHSVYIYMSAARASGGFKSNEFLMRMRSDRVSRVQPLFRFITLYMYIHIKVYAREARPQAPIAAVARAIYAAAQCSCVFSVTQLLSSHSLSLALALCFLAYAIDIRERLIFRCLALVFRCTSIFSRSCYC